MTETSWWAYVKRVAGDVDAGETQAKDIADKAGFDKSAITRWKNGMNADPSFVVKFARAYGRPVAEALTASGLITREESGITDVKVGIPEALAEADNAALLAELRDRLTVRTIARKATGVAPLTDTEGLFTADLTNDFELAATDDNTPIDPERGSA